MAAEEALSLLGTLAPDRARLSVDGFSPELDESGRTLRFRTLVSILTQAAQRVAPPITEPFHGNVDIFTPL